MSAQEFPALPSATDVLSEATATAKVRLLPGRVLPCDLVPLRCGVPLAKGKLTRSAAAWLIGPEGDVLPVQTDILSAWPDGSARWVLVDVLLPIRSATPSEWTCIFTSGRWGLTAPRQAPQELWSEFGLDPAGSPILTGADGRVLVKAFNHSYLRSHGPIRSTSHSRFVDSYAPKVRLQIQQSMWHWSAFSTGKFLSLDVTLHNAARARHRGGLWDLGDAGSLQFLQLIWEGKLTLQGPRRLEFQLQPGCEWVDSAAEFHIHQESSGGEQWNSINHVDRTGNVPWRYRGYKAQTTAGELAGWRATPSIRISSPQGRLTVTVPNFWQQFPMSLGACVLNQPGDRLRLGLFPPRDDRPYELQGGERATHTVWFRFDPPDTDLACADLSWVHDPPRLAPVLDDQTFVPGWPRLSDMAAMPVSRLDSLCDEALNGPASVFVRREELDEYGWRNFGDFFADHETRYYQGPPPLISHFNNQYDVLGGLLLQGLRTEDRRWFELAEALARHVIDVDLYHTTEDRAVFNGGLFWLTDHYRSCGTATHRCFSKFNAKPGQPYGGGPGCEHNYSTGLLAYFWLTGDPAVKEAVVQLAEWVLAMDDGRNTIFALVDDGPTGAATATAEENYHGPGRGAGNSINALLDAWLLTGERTYLTSAERLLQRCVHPRDDIAARNLLNFELRWSYTVFLMAVFKYLECKRELDEMDADYEYARQSLLQYAVWMVENERPYFDRVEQMEFPTETWGAQELRKANVFRWAACYAEEPLRSRLRAKGEEFAERAWHDLCRFPTRTFIRPFTLAMIQGQWDAALRGDSLASAPRASISTAWKPPLEFIPQKARVKRMLASPRGLATILARALNPRRWRLFVDALRRMT